VLNYAQESANNCAAQPASTPEAPRCYQCDLSYAGMDWDDVLVHLVEEHGVSGTDLMSSLCAICGKTFKSAWNLRQHYRTHTTGEKPFECDHCKAAFARQSNLTRHICGVHTGTK